MFDLEEELKKLPASPGVYLMHLSLIHIFNTSSTAIGLRASYADQKMTVSVYGIPILEDGITWDLESKKVERCV